MTRKLLSLLVFHLLSITSFSQGAEIFGNCLYDNTSGRITIRLALSNPTGSSTGQMNLIGMKFGFQYNEAAVNYVGYYSYMYNAGNTGLDDAGFLSFIGTDTYGISGSPSTSVGTESTSSRVASINNSSVQKTMQRRFINRSTNDCFQTVPIPAGQQKVLIDFYFTLVNNNPSYYNLNTPGYGFGTPNFIAQFLTKDNGGHTGNLDDIYKEMAFIVIRQGNTNNPYQPFDMSNEKCENGTNINPIVVDGDKVNFINPIEGVLSAKLKYATVKERSGYAELKWATENNELFDHFEVEREDVDGSFKTVGIVMSDNSVNQKEYSYKEKITGSQTELKYRIKSYNVDGKITYSGAMKLNLKQIGVAEIRIVPNPVATTAVIDLPSTNGNYLCRVYNIDGRMIQNAQLQGRNPVLNVSQLIPGSYFIEAFHPQTGKRYYGKFSKQ